MTDLTLLQKKMQSNPLSRLLLKVLSWLYLAGITARRLIYRAGIFKSRKVMGRVICFGNISAGGTGKTPAAELAAKELAGKGLRVSVILRGYKGKVSRKNPLVLSGEMLTSAFESGDEAQMLAWRLREQRVPVIVCPDRYRAALTAVEKFRSQVVIMDDGFQHFGLRRDENIVVINARKPPGGDALLPLGSLREPVSALARADCVLLTHTDQAGEAGLTLLEEEIIKIKPSIRVIRSIHEPGFFVDLYNMKKVPLKNLAGRVAALSGIGSPESFEQTLESLGLILEQVWRYPDHHVFSPEELESTETLRGNIPLITTMKDFTRFPDNWGDILKCKVYALSISLKITKGRDTWNKLLGL